MSKQYLLICNERGRELLSGCMRGIEFIEVLGMNIDNRHHMLLTPQVTESDIKAINDGEQTI